MDKVRVSLGMLLAMAAVTTAQSITFPSLLQRKGAIESLYVTPATPTTAAPVVLHVTVADALQFDRAETQQIGNTFIIRVYWTEPPAGGYALSPGHGEKSLGVLATGTYRLHVQSLCNNLLAGSKQLTFDVVDAPPAPTPMLDVIDRVWITPSRPNISDSATLRVAGTWPTGGHQLSISIMRLIGWDVTVDLYWNAPHEPVTQVETPFTYETPVKLSIAGTYTVRVRVYLNGLLVDSEAISVEATENNGSDWPWVFPWEFSLPW